MLKDLRFILIILPCFLFCCASQSRISTHQSEIDSLKRELQFLKEQNSQLRREMDELRKPFSEQGLLINQNKADFATQLEEMSQKLEALERQIEDANYRFTAFVQRTGNVGVNSLPVNLGAGTDSLKASPAADAPPVGEDRSREMYNTAYRDLNRGNYQLALQSFQQFLQQYPNTELSDNAQYWIGEIFYDQGRLPNAVEEFEKVIKWYRNGDKVAAALLKIGYSYLGMDEIEQGKLYLEEVVKDYPESREANLAKGRLATLK